MKQSITQYYHRLHSFFRAHRYILFLFMGMGLYIGYFSLFTIGRLRNMYANYFDLGIMHQVVYNTYRALQTGKWGRVLEMTDTLGPSQIYRMAIHNDLLLAFLAPFYFIHDGPETLLVIQTVVVALGGLFSFLIGRTLLRRYLLNDHIPFLLGSAFLMNAYVQRANIYEFHAVTLASTTILAMIYFWLHRKYVWSFSFFMLSIFAKEHIALTTLFFGLYVVVVESKWFQRRFGNIHVNDPMILKNNSQQITLIQRYGYGVTIIVVSLAWFILSMKFIIPQARIDDKAHFAIHYFEAFGKTPTEIIMGIITNPWRFFTMFLFNKESLDYLHTMFMSMGYLSLLAPMAILITVPELAVNMLSSNENMRNIYFHYTALITPLVFYSGIVGMRSIYAWVERMISADCHNKKEKVNAVVETVTMRVVTLLLGAYIVVTTANTAYLKGPLAFAVSGGNMPPWQGAPHLPDVLAWKERLSDDRIRVATTGRIAPYFSGRRYYYYMNTHYDRAEYVLAHPWTAHHGFGSRWASGAYTQLLDDDRYEMIYNNNELEVYRRVR